MIREGTRQAFPMQLFLLAFVSLLTWRPQFTLAENSAVVLPQATPPSPAAASGRNFFRTTSTVDEEGDAEASPSDVDEGSLRSNTIDLALYERAKTFGQTSAERRKVNDILQKLYREFESSLPNVSFAELNSTKDSLLPVNATNVSLSSSSFSLQRDSPALGAGRRSKSQSQLGAFRRRKTSKAKHGRFIDDESPSLRAPEESGDHFQGDIVLTVQQAQALYDSALRSKVRRHKRKFIASPFRRWDPRRPIEYSFDGSHTLKEQKIIELALEHWQNITCLNFRRRVDEPRGNRIVFTDVDGCASNVGRHPLGEPQFVSIAPECMRLGVIAHEVAHALGFWHEQSRPDRDRFVNVIWPNIELGSQGQFTKEQSEDVDDEGIPYDYGSIMHYRSKAFAKTDELFTIQTNVRDYQRTIGQRDQLSFNDIKLMNKVYCSRVCPVQLPCQRGGYTDPRKCDSCRCPDGFTGRLCEEVMGGYGAQCGGIIDLSVTPYLLSSPNYPGLFKEGMECSWLFRAPPGFTVSLTFSGTFDLYCKAKHSLCMDYIEIRNTSDFSNTGMRYCCYSTPPSTIHSSGNELLVLFRSFYRSGRGFRATAVAGRRAG